MERKRLAVFFDGTWNSADDGGAETNVSRLSRSVHATTDTGGVYQSVLYLRGVGTTGLHADHVIQGATGLGIDDNIRSGYMFLAQNYVPGDEIFLFGFSRGAFTARSLVGLLSGTGLLKRQSLSHLSDAWRYYRSDKPHNPAEFMRRTPGVETHLDVKVTFLGVWDTVGSLGVPGHLFDQVNHKLYGFYDTGLCPIVARACQALAIDEHRDNFVPTLWTGDVPEGCSVDQVWFAGAHADVGGGYLTRGLADIPLHWMASQAEAAGLALDWTCLPDASKLDPLAPRHDSSSGLFAFNRILPTVRAVCGQTYDVPFYGKLYVPTGEDHRPLRGTNEAVHRSVVERFGRQAGNCSEDMTGRCVREEYAPRNVAALFNEKGDLKPEVRMVG